MSALYHRNVKKIISSRSWKTGTKSSKCVYISVNFISFSSLEFLSAAKIHLPWIQLQDEHILSFLVDEYKML